MKAIDDDLLAKILSVNKAKLLTLNANKNFEINIISDGVLIRKEIGYHELIAKCKLWMKYNKYYFFPVFFSEYPHTSFDWIVTMEQQASQFKYRDNELMGSGEDEFFAVIEACEFVDKIIKTTLRETLCTHCTQIIAG